MSHSRSATIFHGHTFHEGPPWNPSFRETNCVREVERPTAQGRSRLQISNSKESREGTMKKRGHSILELKKKKVTLFSGRSEIRPWVFLYTFDEIVVVRTLRYLQIGRSKSRIRVFFSFYFFSPRSPTAESRGYLYTYIAVTSHGKPKKRSTTLLTATGVHSYL